jgi:hypothetical protein
LRVARASRRSPSTASIESGRPCRLDTKRRILMALGMRVADRDKVFGAALAVSADGIGRQLAKSA